MHAFEYWSHMHASARFPDLTQNVWCFSHMGEISCPCDFGEVGRGGLIIYCQKLHIHTWLLKPGDMIDFGHLGTCYTDRPVLNFLSLCTRIYITRMKGQNDCMRTFCIDFELHNALIHVAIVNMLEAFSKSKIEQF